MTVEYAELRVQKAVTDTITGVRLFLRQTMRRMRTKKGLLLADQLNLERMDSLIRNMRGVIQASGLQTAVQTEAQELTRLYKLTMKTAKSKGYDKKFDPEFVTTSRASVARLIQGGGMDLMAEGDKLASQINQIVRQAIIGGGDKADLLSDIEKELSISEQQTKVLVSTTIRAFASSMRVQHAQKAGIKWFTYVGPNDPSTRDWCKRWVGTRFTLEQLEEDANDPKGGRGKQPLPASVWRGGWNCRHSLIPLGGKQVGKYPIGPN